MDTECSGVDMITAKKSPDQGVSRVSIVPHQPGEFGVPRLTGAAAPLSLCTGETPFSPPGEIWPRWVLAQASRDHCFSL